MLDLLLQALLSAITVGAVYALIALGLALVFGAMKIINLAHGEMVLLAAYMAVTVESATGLNPYFAIPIAFLATGAVAAVSFLMLNRIRVHRELNSLIFTFAIGIILTNAILLIWKSNGRTTASPYLQEAISVGNLFAFKSEIIALVISLVLMLGLWWWLKRSWYGRAVRAVASNRDAAKLMGINPGKTELVAFLAAACMASVAGVTLYTFGVITPATGHLITVKAFIITILAGVGSIPGVLFAALLLSLTESLTITFASSALQELGGMVLFLVVLFFLPSGLFGKGVRRG